MPPATQARSRSLLSFPFYFLLSFSIQPWLFFWPKRGKSFVYTFVLYTNASSPGLFIGAALKHPSSLRGAQLLGSGSYYTPKEIVEIFSQILGKKATFLQVDADEYKGTLPPAVAAEYLDNQLFVEDPGYFLGASLEPTLTLLDANPTTWAEFLTKNASAWD